MSKATVQMVNDLGFVREEFNVASASGWITFVQDVLNEAAVDVSAAVGASAYADTTDPVKQRVINAEKYSAGAILMDRLLAAIFRSQGSTTEGRPTAWAEQQQRDKYRGLADRNIALITGGLDESFGAPTYEPEAVAQ